jgi:hypothetical protein
MCHISPWGSRILYSLLRSGGDILVSLDLKFKEQEGGVSQSDIPLLNSNIYAVADRSATENVIFYKEKNRP